MRKLLALFLTSTLLLSSLLPQADSMQGARLGGLIEHFREHQRTQPDLAFLDFLAQHYGEASEHRKHPSHSHRMLPAFGATTFFVTGDGLVSAPAFSPVLLGFIEAHFAYACRYSFQWATCLLQPPRA